MMKTYPTSVDPALLDEIESLLEKVVTYETLGLQCPGVCTHQSCFFACLQASCHKFEGSGDITNILPGSKQGSWGDKTSCELIVSPALACVVFIDVRRTWVRKLETLKECHNFLGGFALLECGLRVHENEEAGSLGKGRKLCFDDFWGTLLVRMCEENQMAHQ
jgi:hypothetical protein